MRFGLLALVVCSAVATGCTGAHASNSTATQSLAPITGPTSSAPVSLNGRVTESVPTATTGIEGAAVAITDGPNAGRSGVTNQFGFYTLSDLQPGAFTVSVTANDYVGTSARIASTASSTFDFQLMPVAKTVTHVLTGDIGAGDGTCTDGIYTRSCRIVVIPIHNVGPVDAVLTWTGDGADLDLSLFQTGISTPIDRSAATGAGPEEVQATLTNGGTYEFRITWAGGTGRATYTLRVAHMN
jgi:Carboxypeptidase regulatory-like domain